MKQLLFTPENLKRHLSASPREFVTERDGTTHPFRRTIYTTRDHKLGYVGEIFCVEDAENKETGYSHFILDSINHAVGYEYLMKLFNDNYEEEGFDDALSFMNEIVNIYGKVPFELYLHVFKEVFM